MMGKKNNILILTGIFPPDIGGPARFLENLIEDFFKAGFSVSVLTYGQKDKLRPYPVYRIPKKYPYPLRSLLFFALAFFLSLRHDSIYNQDLYGAGRTSYFIKRFLKKKLVTRFVGDSAWEKAYGQGLVREDILDFQKERYGREIEKLKGRRKKILMASDKIIVASNFLSKLAQMIGVPERRIRVIYNSVDFLETETGLSKKEAKEKINLKGKMILTISRLVPWKGVDMLIRVMPELAQKHGDISLVIVGGGSERGKLEALKDKLKVGNKVIFTGCLDCHRIVEYLRAADVFALNTNYEGMSHAILEAMKTGTPVITTGAGGNPETIKDGETGLLVGFNDKEAWLGAINFMLNNPEGANRLAENAKNDLKRFSWENLVKETVNIFQEI